MAFASLSIASSLLCGRAEASLECLRAIPGIRVFEWEGPAWAANGLAKADRICRHCGAGSGSSRVACMDRAIVEGYRDPAGEVRPLHHRYDSELTNFVRYRMLEESAAVEGESRAHYVLGMGPTGDDSLKAAVADALAKRGGDTLINVTVDRAVTAFPPFGAGSWYRAVRTFVSGTAVRFKTAKR